MLEKYDPFEEMRKFRKKMEEGFERMEASFGSFFREPPFLKAERSLVRKPLSDIKETKTDVIARLELPCIDKKDIKIKVNEKDLEIKAERKEEFKVEKKGFFKQERSYKGFYRRIPFPAPVETSKYKTEYKNGILTVKVHKKPNLRIEHKEK